MIIQKYRLYILMLFYLFVSNSYAEDNECELFGEGNCILFAADSFRFENDDLYLPKGDDNNYTYSLIWSWGEEKARHHVLHTESIQTYLLELMNIDNSKLRFNFQFGLTNFTPDDLVSTGVVYNDSLSLNTYLNFTVSNFFSSLVHYFFVIAIDSSFLTVAIVSLTFTGL